MKTNIVKSFVLLAALLGVVSCAKSRPSGTVYPVGGGIETVEVVSKDFPKGVSPESIVVKDDKGNVITSQIYIDTDGFVKLVYQRPVGENPYILCKGEREAYDTVAYSRFVPERMDDFVYENDVVAGRFYGPALSEPKTLGSEIWVKSTKGLVADKWYREDLAGIRSYH